MSAYPVVLYIEDDARSRKVMDYLLCKELNLQHVAFWEDSYDFQQRMETLQPKPDIVFLDIHLKPYSGFEMLQMLRQMERFAQTPIVALTASVMNEEVYKLRVVGFNSCLAKPIDIDTFPDDLNRILKGEEVWRIITA